MYLTRSARRMAAGFVVLASLAASPALAQDISDSHLKAARAAVSAINATDAFDAILPASALALREELIRKNPDLTDTIDQIVSEQTLALAPRRADLEKEAALAYARVFSEEDLTAMANFYNSPAGQKLLSDGPIVTRQIVQAADIWQTGITRDLAQNVGQLLKSKLGDRVETGDVLDQPLPGADATAPATGN